MERKHSLSKVKGTGLHNLLDAYLLVRAEGKKRTRRVLRTPALVTRESRRVRVIDDDCILCSRSSDLAVSR